MKVKFVKYNIFKLKHKNHKDVTQQYPDYINLG